MPSLTQKVVRTLRHSSPRPVTWLWPNRIAAGTLTLLDGDPDQGKSLLTVDLAARLTAGLPFPDSATAAAPSPVVLLFSEDPEEEAVVPRLLAAGADLDLVHVFRCLTADGVERLPTLPDDTDLLAETIQETNARLVVIDPFLDFLSAGAYSFNDILVRRALAPLARVAAATGAAILLVRHLSKGGQGRRALCRGIGAISIIGAARTAFLAGRHPHDSELRLLACTKNNLAPPPPTLGYRIAADAAGQPLISWTGPEDHAADDIVLKPVREDDGPIAEALTLLRDHLGTGPATRETCLRVATAHGISERTLDRAKAQLRIRSTQKYEHGHNLWYWSLPPDEDSERIMRELFGLRTQETDEAETARPGSDSTPPEDSAGEGKDKLSDAEIDKLFVAKK